MHIVVICPASWIIIANRQYKKPSKAPAIIQTDAMQIIR